MDCLLLVTGGLIEEENQQNGNGPRCIATFHLLLLPLLRCLLLLLIQLSYIVRSFFSIFRSPEVLLHAFGL